jgi:hypothetical protein
MVSEAIALALVMSAERSLTFKAEFLAKQEVFSIPCH